MSLSPWIAVGVDTVPSKRARELRDAWEDFIEDRLRGDDEDPGTPDVRGPIVDSWLRSREAGVDPTGRLPAMSVVELNGARAMWEEHPLRRAGPLIEHCMAETLLDADNLLVVSDADGMLLSIKGDTQLRNRAADEMNFVEGALWSEPSAGTNAIGTAMAAAHAVQVFAAEHFTEPVQRWTCSAAPVMDPDTGQMLGIIDLTGDFSVVNPLSLAVVVATARAVEELLRGELHERDDRLRTRYAELLGPASAGAALVTGAGRILLDPGRRWSRVALQAIPAGGGVLALPSGLEAIAEPIAEDDVYVVRRNSPSRRPPRPRLELRVLGDERPEVRLDGVVLHLRPRHVEMLTILALHRGHLNAEVMCAELYGDDGHPASVRVEMSRLRRLLPDMLESEGYGLTGPLGSDVRRVRALLDRGAVCEAAEAYPGPLLPGSVAPGIERARDELEGWVRHAVITSDDADALSAWVRSSSGASDLLAWQRLLAALPYTDPRRSRAVARTRVLRRELGLHR
ncbi:MAG TPA: GAF domain-containing protein [Solirubrobacteraceae bacterium]|nr:GAF domain-containing protein [Solirubrobacteraceae bacterium]